MPNRLDRDEFLRIVTGQLPTPAVKDLPMIRKKSKSRPTEAECNILSVIWERRSATVREVYDDLSERRQIGYTTVLKFMQIMTAKGILERDTSVRPQVYRAAQPQAQTQRTLLRALLDQAFSGSPGSLVLQALSMRKSSPEEIEEIRTLLDKLEKRGA